MSTETVEPFSSHKVPEMPPVLGELDSAPKLINGNVIPLDVDSVAMLPVGSAITEPAYPDSRSLTIAPPLEVTMTTSVGTGKLMPVEIQEPHRSTPRFKMRSARADDIEAIVDVDMRAFKSVYSEYDTENADLRNELVEKFRGRYEKVGGEWMPVLEREGKIVGFMTCCPTSKRPEDFKSWEDTTDNGTLEATYDPDGKNAYVVTLSVLPEGTQGKDMLFANQIGKMLREGYEVGFFESRLPGLRRWVEQQCRANGTAIGNLTEQEQDAYAEKYFGLKSVVEGKEVRRDRLLRLYEQVGCKCLKLVPDAYEDAPSMNYGVVCTYDGKELFDGSMLPTRLPDNRVTRWLFGTALQAVSRSPKLTQKVFG